MRNGSAGLESLKAKRERKEKGRGKGKGKSKIAARPIAQCEKEKVSPCSQKDWDRQILSIPAPPKVSKAAEVWVLGREGQPSRLQE